MQDEQNISFIIPAYNCTAFLAAAVASIFDGNFQTGDEIVLVNDASTDGTQALIDALRDKHPEIRAFRHHFNKGSAAAARNTGIDNARHELLFCLDADNLLVPGSVCQLRRYLATSKADAAAFQELHYFTTNVQEITHKWTYQAGLINLADALCTHVWAGPSGNYLFTRASWLRAGRYHESVGGAVDSWAFGIAQLATGSRFVVLPDTFYYHRWGHASASTLETVQAWYSLKAVQVLLPFLHLLEDEDVEYLFSKDGRETWFSKLEQRPLRVKGCDPGRGGLIQWPPRKKRAFIRRVRARLAFMIAPSPG